MMVPASMAFLMVPGSMSCRRRRSTRRRRTKNNLGDRVPRSDDVIMLSSLYIRYRITVLVRGPMYQNNGPNRRIGDRRREYENKKREARSDEHELSTTVTMAFPRSPQCMIY
eukprot:scaffold259866_cov36-Attheya_sp.AAC.2